MPNKKSNSTPSLAPRILRQLNALCDVVHNEQHAVAKLSSKDQQALLKNIQQVEKRLKSSQPSNRQNLREVPNGLYQGSHNELQLTLRVDMTETGIISLDIFRITQSGQNYLLSARTQPGESLNDQQPMAMVAQNASGQLAMASLSLTVAPLKQLNATFTLQGALAGIAVQIPLVWQAKKIQDAFRHIGLEVDYEINIDRLPTYTHNNREITLAGCFAQAGINLEELGGRDQIPSPARGWDDAQLHGLMTRFADTPVDQKTWALHLLMLSKATEERLLGIMFDTGSSDLNQLPRQGAAVFTAPMQDHPAGAERKLIQTIVHELGHALNLAHRFERGVSMANSTSFMNYDWRYMGGNQTKLFWQRFNFSFDEDEIRFMRHAPWHQLVPGGAEFHTVRYWDDGSGGYSPYLPEEPLQELQLLLETPPNQGLFPFGSPVFLSVHLSNNSGKTIDIPDFYLDPKAGLLEILVRRIPAQQSSQPNLQRFQPVISRCYDWKKRSGDVLKPGDKMSNNLNLTFGAAGFMFAEPGTYQISAVLAIPDGEQGKEFVVNSNTLLIRIAYPKDMQEERDALDLFHPEVGLYFALGGSDVLPKAVSYLEVIKERRQQNKLNITDPVVAYITRCQAINYSREFVSQRENTFHVRKPDINKARELLQSLPAAGAALFDVQTQQATLKLLQKLESIPIADKK